MTYYISVTLSLLLCATLDGVQGQDDLPTVYEYYTKNGIQSGLEALPDEGQVCKSTIVRHISADAAYNAEASYSYCDQSAIFTSDFLLMIFCDRKKQKILINFSPAKDGRLLNTKLITVPVKDAFHDNTYSRLNGKNITIYSGAIHYFRVHPEYWRDRLRKLRAAGLIAVETYVPWNLHEPEMDIFDFGDGGRDYSEFINVRKFIEMAQEEDLLVILRPGPYICAEWVMGGLPSWLLRIPDIQMRTSEKQYTERVEKFFNALLPALNDLQFTNNGSIIAVQLENEYSSVSYPSGPDQQHLYDLETIVKNAGIKELLFTSDSAPLAKGSIPTVLKTINFQNNPTTRLDNLKKGQPDKPAMVMEYWTGWYDHWFTDKSGRNDFTAEDFGKNLETILRYPASFNLYMFIGGTSWGFLNGANAVITKVATQFDVSSYDYGAPLTEAGDYTEKYNVLIDIVKKYQPVQFKNPEIPEESSKAAYSSVTIQEYLEITDILNQTAESAIESEDVISMEDLPINNNSGQSHGYIWYRKTNLSIMAGDVLQISGYIHDALQVFVDGKLQTKVLESKQDTNGFGYWKLGNGELNLSDSGSTLDIIVENMGRVNFGVITYKDHKGIYEGPVSINGEALKNWEIIPLEFNKKWVQGLDTIPWHPFNADDVKIGFGLYRGILNISEDEKPNDTFLESKGWTKGVVFVNGFNLGRYNKLGPQQTLYIPAPLLKPGQNIIVIFEQFMPNSEVTFTDKPNLG